MERDARWPTHQLRRAEVPRQRREYLGAMFTPTELSAHVERMMQIRYTAQVYYSDCKYLRQPDSVEGQAVVANDPFIQRSLHGACVVSVLQLSKLYGKNNDHYTLHGLLKVLENEHRRSEWKEKLSLAAIKNLDHKLTAPQVVVARKWLLTLRDKFFAHSDRTFADLNTELASYEDRMELLLKVSDEVLSEGLFPVLEQYYYDIPSEYARASGVLDRLAVHLVPR